MGYRKTYLVISLCIFLCSDINKPNLPMTVCQLRSGFEEAISEVILRVLTSIAVGGGNTARFMPSSRQELKPGYPTTDSRRSSLPPPFLIQNPVSGDFTICQCLSTRLVNSRSSCFLTVIGLVRVSPPKTLETYI